MKIGNHAPRRVIDNKPKKVPKRHPNIIAIFEKMYRVRMRQIDTRSIEEMRTYGTLGTGDKKIDEAQAFSNIYVHLTINDMVEYFRQGIGFRLTQEDDARKIYEAVCNHTAMWRKALEHALNMGDAPVEDFIAMENFAAAIYDKAKFEYTKPPSGPIARGSLTEFLYSGSTIRGMSYNQDNQRSTSKTHKEGSKLKDMTHTPDIAVFRNALMSKLQTGNERS